MRSVRLLAVAVLAVLMVATLFLGFVGTQRVQAQEFTVTVTVWNCDTQTPLTGESVYLSQGTTAQTYVACPTGCAVPGPDKDGKVTFSLPTDTYIGVFSTSLPLTVWVYDVANSHYNTYGPYYLQPGNIDILIDFSTSDTCPAGPAVGGVVATVNAFTVLAPWIAVISLVGGIGALAVVAKKRR